MSKYPEHEKLSAIRDESQAIGEFLDYGLADQGLTLAEWDTDTPKLYPCGKPIQTILAEYFDIDQNVIEAEKRQMLDELRAWNAPPVPFYTRMTLGVYEAERDKRRQAKGLRGPGESVGRRALR